MAQSRFRVLSALAALLVSLVVITSTGKCQDPPRLPGVTSVDSAQVDVIPYDPPLKYRAWWDEVASCAIASKAVRQSYAKIRWYWVPGQAFSIYGSGPYIGYAQVWSNQIWVSGSYMLNKNLVQHEMLHYILWQQGTESAQHPKPFGVCVDRPLKKSA